MLLCWGKQVKFSIKKILWIIFQATGAYKLTPHWEWESDEECEKDGKVLLWCLLGWEMNEMNGTQDLVNFFEQWRMKWVCDFQLFLFFFFSLSPKRWNISSSMLLPCLRDALVILPNSSLWRDIHILSLARFVIYFLPTHRMWLRLSRLPNSSVLLIQFGRQKFALLFTFMMCCVSSWKWQNNNFFSLKLLWMKWIFLAVVWKWE